MHKLPQAMPTRNEITNTRLEKLIPEIAASKYGKYPMRQKQWLPVKTGINPDGGPCYIKGPDNGLKTDYVFGSGPQGELYYHLMTQQSYVILYKRLKAAEPTAVCTCFSSIEVREEAKDHAVVSRIIYYRAKASIPDDVQASKEAAKRFVDMVEGIPGHD
jgi:hypothetical protein